MINIYGYHKKDVFLYKNNDLFMYMCKSIKCFYKLLLKSCLETGFKGIVIKVNQVK